MTGETSPCFWSADQAQAFEYRAWFCLSLITLAIQPSLRLVIDSWFDMIARQHRLESH